MQSSGYAPLVWLASHWQAICGWVSAIFLGFKVLRWITRTTQWTQDLKERAETAESTISLLATNHLPHMQMALEQNNRILNDQTDQLERMNETLNHIRDGIVSVLTRTHK